MSVSIDERTYELNPVHIKAIVRNIDAAFQYPPGFRELRYVSGLAEEVGEFVGAYHRYSGAARRQGGKREVATELADVVICAYTAAHVLGVDLDKAVRDKLAIIFTRGWRN